MITVNILFNDEDLHLKNCIESLGYQSSISCVQIITTSDIGKYHEDAKSIVKQLRDKEQFKNVTFRIVPYLFNNNFSALRNFANSICQTDYILHLDCDERLQVPKEYSVFKELNKNNGDIFMGKVFGWHTYIRKESEYYKYDCARLMKREVEWINEVHEIPNGDNKIITYDYNYKISHLGYDIPKAEMMEKIQRNIELLNTAKSMDSKTRKMYLNLTAQIINA